MTTKIILKVYSYFKGVRVRGRYGNEELVIVVALLICVL